MKRNISEDRQRELKEIGVEIRFDKERINDAIDSSLKQYFKQYICVGGMPEVVEEFVYSRDMNNVLKIQRDLISSYKDDFGKHINENGYESINISLLSKINVVFNSIPSQLAKENNKFVYKQLGQHARKDMYEEAIDWLISFGLIVPCYNLKSIELPLEGNKDSDCFKLYFADTGLLICQLLWQKKLLLSLLLIKIVIFIGISLDR